MFLLDCIRQPRIIGPQLQLERLSLHCEALFKKLELRLLILVKREPVMQHFVKLGARLRWVGKDRPSNKDAAYRREEAGQDGQEQTEASAHGSPINSVEGANG
jgi:hypothetical protein